MLKKKKKNSTDRETKLERERERELTSFVLDNLEGIEERDGNEIIRNLYKNEDGIGMVEVDESLNKVKL